MNKKVAGMALCVTMCAVLFAGCGKKKTVEKTEKVDYDKAVTLGDYKTISLKTADIDKELQSQIDQLLEQNKTYETVKKGVVADGDTVNIYYVGKVDGKEFDGGSLTKDTNPSGYDLTIGSNTFIDGFEKALIGKKIGGTYDVDVTFPSDYSLNADLAGKPAVFTVTINSKQGKENIPKFDDAFVKEKVSGYDSAEEYKAAMRKDVVQGLAWDKVMDASKINEYPKQFVEDNKTRLESAMNTYLSQNGATLEDYMKSQNLTQESYDAQKEQTAKDAAGEEVVYNAIAQKEKIEVSKDEYQKQIKDVMTSNNIDSEDTLNKNFKSYYGFDAKTIVMKDMLRQKVEEYLAGNVVES